MSACTVNKREERRAKCLAEATDAQFAYIRKCAVKVSKSAQTRASRHRLRKIKKKCKRDKTKAICLVNEIIPVARVASPPILVGCLGNADEAWKLMKHARNGDGTEWN